MCTDNKPSEFSLKPKASMLHSASNLQGRARSLFGCFSFEGKGLELTNKLILVFVLNIGFHKAFYTTCSDISHP